MSQEEGNKEAKPSVGSKVALGTIILAVIGLLTAFFNQGGIELLKEIQRSGSQQPPSTPTATPIPSPTSTPTPTPTPTPPPTETPAEPQPIPTNSPQKVEDNDFRFEFQSCQRNGSKVICDLSITNLANIDRDIQLSASYGRESFSRIIDTAGNEYQATLSQLGQAQQYAGNPVKVKLIQDIPMKGSLVFDNVPQEVDKLAIIEVAYVFHNPYNVYRTAQFRDVNIEPVAR